MPLARPAHDVHMVIDQAGDDCLFIEVHDLRLGSHIPGDLIVGTDGEKCGRLIITSTTNGTVVILFPEKAGGVGLTCH